MPYLNIRNALKTRIEAVSGIGKVHTYLRWSLEPTGSDNFNTIFADITGMVNVWIITREKFEDDHANEDNKIIRRHHLTVYAYHGHLDTDSVKAELVFQDLLEAVEANLRTGDRTLSASCLTYSLPEFTKIGYASLGNRKDAYVCCEIKLLVDEVL